MATRHACARCHRADAFPASSRRRISLLQDTHAFDFTRVGPRICLPQHFSERATACLCGATFSSPHLQRGRLLASSAASAVVRFRIFRLSQSVSSTVPGALHFAVSCCPCMNSQGRVLSNTFTARICCAISLFFRCTRVVAVTWCHRGATAQRLPGRALRLRSPPAPVRI